MQCHEMNVCKYTCRACAGQACEKYLCLCACHCVYVCYCVLYIIMITICMGVYVYICKYTRVYVYAEYIHLSFVYIYIHKVHVEIRNYIFMNNLIICSPSSQFLGCTVTRKSHQVGISSWATGGVNTAAFCGCEFLHHLGTMKGNYQALWIISEEWDCNIL